MTSHGKKVIISSAIVAAIAAFVLGIRRSRDAETPAERHAA
ncbi:hypothetical protein [Haloechinothrix halophila]|nr:hypothetical protein [Haloechinothrix halophila]